LLQIATVLAQTSHPKQALAVLSPGDTNSQQGPDRAFDTWLLGLTAYARLGQRQPADRIGQMAELRVDDAAPEARLRLRAALRKMAPFSLVGENRAQKGNSAQN
jgi:hypothetical protein